MSTGPEVGATEGVFMTISSSIILDYAVVGVLTHAWSVTPRALCRNAGLFAFSRRGYPCMSRRRSLHSCSNLARAGGRYPPPAGRRRTPDDRTPGYRRLGGARRGGAGGLADGPRLRDPRGTGPGRHGRRLQGTAGEFEAA